MERGERMERGGEDGGRWRDEGEKGVEWIGGAGR